MIKIMKDAHFIHEFPASCPLDRFHSYILDAFLDSSFVNNRIVSPSDFLVNMIVVHFKFCHYLYFTQLLIFQNHSFKLV
jgi:hypothetical protein